MQHDVAACHFIHQAFNEDFFRTEGIATVDQVYLRGDIRQIQSLFHCGVAAADHRHFLVAIEESVAGSARGNAAAFEGFFGRQAQVTGGSAGGDDQRVTGVLAAVACQTERAVLQIDAADMVENDLGFKFCGMRVHALHQQRTGEIVRIAWPVFHFRRGGQLTAFFHPGDQHRLQVGACGIDRRGVSRRSRTKDKQFTVFGCAHEIPIIIGIHWAGIVGNLLS